MNLRATDFDGRKLKRTGIVPVLFAASWCPSAKGSNQSSSLSYVSEVLTVELVDLSDDDNPLWDGLEIETVPTVILFREGEIAFRGDGAPGRGLSPAIMNDIIRAIDSNSITNQS